jgi:hypothetical protein
MFVLIALSGCARPIRTGPIIANYARAECIPVTAIPGMPNFARWDYPLKLPDGGVVHVFGVQAPGGRIDIRFVADGATRVAADAGDYVYPEDVRVDAAHALLYVKANGVRAVGGKSEAWLFEYDLRQRRPRDRARVNPAVLPRTCFESKQ